MVNPKTERSSWQLNDSDQNLINLAIQEDLSVMLFDATTHFLFPKSRMQTAKAHIISKHPTPIILAGLPLLPALFAHMSGEYEIQTEKNDGDCIETGATILTFSGPAFGLLMLERTILNFLQHLSAIATMTHVFQSKIAHTDTKILDTRKTIPGFRHLAKYAVQCGGGVNHRLGLYDAIMIKDTHVDLLGGMDAALSCLPNDILQEMPVIAEVRNEEELTIVLEKGVHKVSRILLDNMDEKALRHAVYITKKRIPLEASGNMRLENIVTVAETGVDFISVGKITHSAGSVDLSMRSEL